MSSAATSHPPTGDEPPLPPASDSVVSPSQQAATIRGPSSSTSSSSSYSSVPSSSRSLSRAFLELVLRPPPPPSSQATPRSSTPSPSSAAAAAGSSIVLPPLNASFALGTSTTGNTPPMSNMRLQRSSSSVSTQSLSYKPQRPSSLASEATTGGGDDDDDDEDEEADADGTAELVEAQAKADAQSNGGPATAKSDASASGASDAGEAAESASDRAADAPPSASSFGTTASSSGSASSFSAIAAGRRPSNTPTYTTISAAAVQEAIGRILTLLRSEDEMEEDERIEEIRKEIAETLRGLEGKDVPSGRLDNLVLDLLHRYHEDQQALASSTSSISTALPTGTPGSPYLSSALLHRRPSSVRSSSSISARPWTPTRPSFESIAVPTAASTTSSAGSASSHVPTFDAVTTSMASAAINPSSPFAASPLSASLGSSSGPIIPPSSPAQYGLGAIGSGSPRASPRLWNRTISSSSVGSGSAVNWSSLTSSASMATGTPVQPGASPSAGVNPPASPAAVASAGSGPSSLLLAATTGQGATSRPASPSPLGSPRFNIAATEFKPRTSSASSPGGPSNLARTSSFLAASSSPTAKSALGRSSRSAAQDGSDDSEENDEFSPFATSSRQRLGGAAGMSHLAAGRPDSDFGSWNGSAASQTSSSGEYDPSPLSSGITRLGGGDGGYDDASMAGEEGSFMGGALSMTPFDVLQSIVNAPSSRAGLQQPKWTAEQLEEALAQNGWDVDATLGSIAEGGGLPPSSRASAAPTGPAGRGLAPSGPRGGPGSNPTSPALAPRHPRSFAAVSGAGQVPSPGITDAGPGRAGISIMSKEAFQSYRNAAAGGGGATSVPPAAAGRFGSPRIAPAGPAGYAAAAGQSPVGSPATPGAIAAAAAMAQGGGPGAGPGRVCRYFLAGECRRADCRFSHDLGRALCRFWLRGQCLNNPCSFLHDYDVVNALASGIASSGATTASGSASSASAAEPETPPNEDFPELHAAPLGPKAQRKGGPSAPPTGPADPSRTRWATALQRKPAGPMAMVQQGEANVVSVHSRGAPMRPIPSGPRATSVGAANAAGESGKASSRIPLRPPSLLPTLTTGRGASVAYNSHRSTALNLSEERNRCFARAADAWKSGDGATARQWSARGQTINGQMSEESRKAAAAIVKQRNVELREKLTGGGPGSGEGNLSDEPGARGMRGKSVGAGWGICLGVTSQRGLAPPHHAGAQHSLSAEERAESFLDLHGLHSDEAVEIVEAFLIGLEKEAIRGLAYLGIGKASHSSTATDRRRVKLSPAVRQFLASWGYPFHEAEGIIVVDPLSHF